MEEYAHFLAAKRDLDARSMDERVWRRFVDGARRRGTTRGRLRLLEIGAGLGATACRIMDALRGSPVEYTLLDASPVHLAAARKVVRTHFLSAGLELIRRSDGQLQSPQSEIPFSMVFVEGDATAEAEVGPLGRFDAVVGQAVLDLVDVEKDLDRFMSFLMPGGLFYFPLTYDGLTYFGPAVDNDLDARLVAVYNDSMDQRAMRAGRSGGSRSGRLALERLWRLKPAVLEVASSDWIVVSGPDGYPPGEEAVLNEILHLVEKEARLAGATDEATLANWLSARRKQIASGELIYISHHLDLMGELAV